VTAILRFFLRNLRLCNVGITDGGLINCPLKMGSVAIPSFINIGSGIRKFLGGIHINTHTAR
jgi:hypothetical protein